MRRSHKHEIKPVLPLKIKKQHILLPLLLLFLLSPIPAVCGSCLIMSVYSRMNEKTSLLAKEDISLHIPGGLSTLRHDWYPFVNTFEANVGFRNFTGRSSLSLTILYNFPAFSPLHGCSHLYDTESPYYNSFYGAYLVQDETFAPYGFQKDANGTLSPNVAELALVPKYDYFSLVLSEFSLDRADAVFDFTVTDIKENVDYAGETGFFCMDALLTVNGSSHEYRGFTPSYLQYGKPRFKALQPLQPVSMVGRIYGKYLEDKNTSLFYYIVAADREVLEQCDQEILSKSYRSRFFKNK